MKINLLLIDDDQVSLLIAKKYLTDHGINELVEEDPILFTNAGEALEFLLKEKTAHKQDVFWILLDINMPNLNGWDFLELVESNSLQSLVKVVMLTSSISEVDRNKADAFETVHGYFSKPMNQEKCEEFKSIIQGKAN